jgi:hypothetical protein
VAKRSGHLAIVLGLAVMSSSSGCGGGTPTEPGSSDDWPVRISGAGSTCGNASGTYVVSGFSSRVVNPSAAPPLEARVRVGETIKLQVNYVGCGFTADETWTTTNPTVGTVERETQYTARADFHALAPGQLSVFVEFRAPGDGRYRTTTGYCKADAQYPGLPGLGGCGNPVKIGTVTVAP